MKLATEYMDFIKNSESNTLIHELRCLSGSYYEFDKPCEQRTDEVKNKVLFILSELEHR